MPGGPQNLMSVRHVVSEAMEEESMLAGQRALVAMKMGQW